MKRRILSVILALVLVMSIGAPAFAEEKTVTPFILVRGMDFTGLIYKAGTSEEKNCLGEIKAADIMGVIAKTIATGVFKWSWDAAADVACDYARDLMGLMACDKYGRSKYDVSVPQYPKAMSNYPDFVASLGDTDEGGIVKGAIKRYGAENVYLYNYDWRLDPFYHADKINEMVNEALAASGAEKVNILCASMGGVETVSYMYKYGWDKLNRVIFLSSTITGTHVTSDLLSGKIDFDDEVVCNYLSNLTGNKALKALITVLNKTGAAKGICNLLNDFLIPNLKDEVYDTFLLETFGTIPAVWALVLPEQYDDCIEYMFGGKEDEYADFIALTKEYQTMAAQRDDMLKKAESEGVSICLMAGYGKACVPVYTGGNCNGDTILEADRMLGKAKVAPLDGKLEDLSGSRVSPDGMVDLSDVLFPETTWAIKYAKHVGCDYGSDIAEFMFTLMDYDGRVTVTSLSQYPQFMVSSDGTDIVK